MRMFTGSARDMLDGWFESDALKVALATDGVIGSNAGPRTPGTAYVLMHHVMGGVGGVRGLWGFVRGGMGALSEALGRAAAGRRRRDPGQRRGRPLRDPRRPRHRRRAARRQRVSARASSISNADPEAHVLRPGRPPAPAARVRRPARRAIAAKAPRSRSTWRWASCPASRRCPGTTLGPQHTGTTHICPEHGLARAGLGRRQVRRAVARAAARDHHPDRLRPVAGAAGQAPHVDLRPVRAVSPARGRVGDRSARQFVDRCHRTCWPSTRRTFAARSSTCTRCRRSTWSASTA